MGVLERFTALFSGYEKAYGSYDPNVKPDPATGKVAGAARTIRGEVSPEFIKGHLTGEGHGLGVVPLRDDCSCVFGAIDVDIQGKVKIRDADRELPVLEARVKLLGLPLVVCRSKSGGAHLYLFLTEPCPASIVIDQLSSWAALLGYGGCEIFPKQYTRSGPDDVGNWLNMPYFAAQRTTRYCVKDGKGVNLPDFLDYAESMRLTPEALDTFEPVADDSGLFADGPPCLQLLAPMGFPAGTRNEGLFNVAIYFKKKNPDGWQDDVIAFNTKNMDPPLKNSEVQIILKSIEKKDYGYGCNKPPINSHCNRRECVKRDFGIGGGNGGAAGQGLTIDSLTKLEVRDATTQEVTSARWILDIDGRRVEVRTQDLFDQRALQRIAAERLSKIVSEMPKPRWERRLRELMDTVTVQAEPQDASVEGQFRLLLDQFLTQQGRAKHRDELLRGQPWADAETGRTFFRSNDLFQYLKQRYFQVTEQQEVWGFLRKHGAEKRDFNIKGKFCSTWHVATPQVFDETAPLETPDFTGAAF